MKRRSFLSLTSLAAPVSSLTAAEFAPKDDPTELWWPMVSEVDRFRAVSIEGRLELAVALARPGEEELEAVQESGSVVGYSLRGRPLIGGFSPGITVISVFDLRWDDRPIAVPPRFWNDLAGFRLQTLSVDLETLELDQRSQAEACLAALDHPRIVLSADEGTALIEWDRREKGGLHSTFRWVISKSGTVLRHRQRSSLVA
jgi:hypothetical protein